MTKNSKSLSKFEIVCIVTASIIAVLFAVVLIFEFTAPVYHIKDGKVEIKNQTYEFSEWRCDKTDERIGFIADAPRFGKALFLPFEHGVYSVAGDDEHLFYQLYDITSDKGGDLFLKREDVELGTPTLEDTSKIVYNDKQTTDKKTISALFDLRNSDEKAQERRVPCHCKELKIYSKRYPGLYYTLEFYQYENGDCYIDPQFMHGFNVVKMPDELVTALGIEKEVDPIISE